MLTANLAEFDEAELSAALGAARSRYMPADSTNREGVLASRSIIDATITTSYGVSPTLAADSSMPAAAAISSNRAVIWLMSMASSASSPSSMR